MSPLSTPFDISRLRQLAARNRNQAEAAERAFRWLGWAVLFAAALWLYLPSVSADIVWDDAARIGLAAAPTGQPYRDVVRFDRELGEGPERYRPLTQLSLRLDQLRGGGPAHYHLTSVLLHLLNIVLLFFSARAMQLTRGAAWLAALFFAVYPLGIHAVGHVAAREEVLALPFILGAFLLHASGRWRYQPLAVLCFALALLARPAAAGAGLLFLARELRTGRSWRVVLARMIPYAAIGGVVLLVVRQHFGSLGFMSAREGQPLDLLRTGGVAFYDLFQLMLRPFVRSEPSVLSFRAENLVPWVRGWAEPRMLVGIAFLLGYAAATWLTLRGRGRAFVALAALPALWMPLDSLFFGRAFDLSRNLYAPSAAFVMLLALVVERAGFEPGAGHLRRGLVSGAAAVLLLSFLVAGQARLAVWRDEGNVYLEAVNRYPSVAAFHAAYGTWLARSGDELPAVDELRHATEMEPTLAAAHYNLGLLYLSLARNGEAAVVFQRAASLDPKDAGAWYRLSLAERRNGNIEAALGAAERAISLDGRRAEYRLALSAARLDYGDLAEAEAEAQQAIVLDPRAWGGYTAMAHVLRRAGRLESAVTTADRAVRLDPRAPEALLERGRCLAAAGRVAEALEDVERYLRLERRPDRAALQLREDLKRK
ncbi:MAG: tetratricopeptide repeat protein [Candidatus Eisenbacteria bacterium]|nr:tetratricopeptide repeat protein [Candidatus Eisenbacteria bacterium]